MLNNAMQCFSLAMAKALKNNDFLDQRSVDKIQLLSIMSYVRNLFL